MIVLDLLMLLSKLVGVVFLFAAAFGLLRFSDPFQRMHAATKAGTLGAGFVVLGAMLELQRFDATLVGLAVVLFLLLTIPVAGHLLGRASYISGADIRGLKGEDSLLNVLPRHEKSLELRLLEDHHSDSSSVPSSAEPLAPVENGRPEGREPIESNVSQ